MIQEYREFLLRASLSGIENKHLLFLYQDLERQYEEYLSFLSGKERGEMDKKWKNRFLRISSFDFELAIKKMETMQIHTLIIEDDFYPEELARTDNPPVVLYYMGDIQLLEYPRLGFVGARKHTDYGARVCKKILYELKDCELVSVSGLAHGLDGVAHWASLENGIPTIGVLGNGIDQCYPKVNYNLWLKMKEVGLILSEYPPGTPPKPFRFPERNRIIAALSHGLIVLEAQEKSGSLITARLAAEYGKEVLAVPGNIDSIYSTGTNRLIRDGAIPLISVEDIFDSVKQIEKNKKKLKKNMDDLSEDELCVFNGIVQGFQNLDLLSINLKYDASAIMSILTMLELKGYITGVDSERISIL